MQKAQIGVGSKTPDSRQVLGVLFREFHVVLNFLNKLKNHSLDKLGVEHSIFLLLTDRQTDRLTT